MSAEVYGGQRVLVLGAAGFIGRWVARKLSEVGADLCLAVRDRAAAETVFSNYQISGEITVVDVERSRDVAELIARVKPCITFNLAGYGVDPTESDEQRFHRVNAELPEILARSATTGGAAWNGLHVVHAGSALEYGPAEGTLTERTMTQPTTAYGKSKLAGTLNLSRVLEERRTARGLTARLFTVYGPGEHRGRLLPSLLETADTGVPLQLTSGLQHRDFTYVEDAAEGMLRLGAALPVPGNVVNLATGILTPVREFAEDAAQLLSIPPDKLRFGALPTRGEEMHTTAIDVSLLRDHTGWTPRTDIVSGIRRTRDFVNGLSAS